MNKTEKAVFGHLLQTIFETCPRKYRYGLVEGIPKETANLTTALTTITKHLKENKFSPEETASSCLLTLSREINDWHLDYLFEKHGGLR